MEKPKKPNFDETKDTLGFIKNGYTFKPMGSFPAVKSDMVEAKGIIVPTGDNYIDEFVSFEGTKKRVREGRKISELPIYATKSENYDARKLHKDFLGDEIGQFKVVDWNPIKPCWHIDKIRIQHSKVIHTQDSLDVPCLEDAMRNLAGELICKLPMDELCEIFEFKTSNSDNQIKLTCELK
jgi:hypothetical protein